jgi:two-component system, cell cycle response regulator DivK
MLDFSSYTVLVIDNELDNLKVVNEILGYAGATVHMAGSGIDGLAMLKSIKPSFILLDLSMPDLDGWETLKCIRADSAIAAIPVIALTAHAMEGDRERVMASGFDGYIAKPFRLANLTKDIYECLQRPTARRMVY